MPTVNEVIERVQRAKPSAFDDADKARVLMELDGRLYEEMTRFDSPDALPPKAYPDDADAPLLVGAPYDGIYDLYLTAMLEYWMRDYDAYNATAALYAERLAEYRAAWRREHVPEDRGAFRVWRRDG